MKTEDIGDVIAKHTGDAVIQHASGKKNSEAGSKAGPDQVSRLAACYAQNLARQIPQELKNDWMKEAASWTWETKEQLFQKSKEWFEFNGLGFSHSEAFMALHRAKDEKFRNVNDAVANIQSEQTSGNMTTTPTVLPEHNWEQIKKHTDADVDSAIEQESRCRSSERCVTPIEVLPPEVTARTPEQKQDRFLVLDARVRKGAQTMVDAAMALAEIKKYELYRPKFKTFAMYLKSVEDISRQYAHLLMKAGETAQEMSTIVDNHNDIHLRRDQIPQTESHLRVLSKLCDAKQRCEILAEVIKDKGPKYTAADLAKKIDPLVPRAQKKLTSIGENTAAPQDKVASALDELESLLSSLHKLDPQISDLLRQIRCWMNPKREGLQ